MKKLISGSILLTLLWHPGHSQLDTSTLVDNRWTDIWGTQALPINNSNWAYENDLNSHPFYGFFIMGPGHVIHPQDCYFYPFDPIKNKWTKTNSSFRPPRGCLSSFAVSSQDTAILHLGGGEANHQWSQGGFASDYKSISPNNGRGNAVWAYSFNRNRWSQMKGAAALPPNGYTRIPRFDPVHDLTVTAKDGDTWIYNYQYNWSARYSTPTNFPEYGYVSAVDERRGLFYVFTSSLYAFNPETATWSQISGTMPPAVAGGGGVNSMAYDSRNDILLYLTDNGATWIFDCAAKTWSPASPANSPAATGRVTYNRALNLFMLLGGRLTTGGISRGGSTQGIWMYRYKKGPGIFANMAAAPQVSLDLTGGMAKVSWKGVTGATGYNIYRATANPYPKGFVKLNSSPVTGLSYTDGGAVSGTWYSYRVSAITNSVEGELSRHLYTRPGRVLDVAASVESSSSVRVSWTANPEVDLSGYNIYRATASSIYNTGSFSYTKLNGSPVAALEYLDNTDLSDGVARGYVVRAVNAFGNESGYSGEATTFPNPVEWAYTIPQQTVNGLKMALRWQPPVRTSITGVNLYRAVGGGPVLINTAGRITDSLTFWDMPPQVGTDGYSLMGNSYFVRAVNTLGQEGFMTDQISPVNNEYGPGIVPSSQRFNYADYLPPGGLSVESRSPSPAAVARVFPNPVAGSLSVDLPGLEKAELKSFEIYSLNGQRVAVLSPQRRAAGGGAFTWRAESLPPGVYLLKISAGKMAYHFRFVKMD